MQCGDVVREAYELLLRSAEPILRWGSCDQVPSWTFEEFDLIFLWGYLEFCLGKYGIAGYGLVCLCWVANGLFQVSSVHIFIYPSKITMFQSAMALLCQLWQGQGEHSKQLKPETVMGVGRPVYSVHQLNTFMPLILVFLCIQFYVLVLCSRAHRNRVTWFMWPIYVGKKT